MIYKKDANFPYPILANTSDSYSENYFDLDVNVNDDVEYYYFNISYEIDSEFIRSLINDRKAQLILIIQTKDSKFFKLKPNQKQVKVKKSRISLKDKTSIQMHIQALEDINFESNHDLIDFYTQFRDEIVVNKNSLLGYSNVVNFDGRIKKPFELFEKKLDENLTSEIKIELGHETIIIHYKDKDFQFSDLPKSSSLNNAYIYTGLTKALQNFIINHGEDGEVDLEDLEEEPDDPLDLKLYNLIPKKQIKELSFDNIDEAIYKMTDKIIEKYSSAVRGLMSVGD